MSPKNVKINSGFCCDQSTYYISVYDAILHKNCFDNIANIIKDLTTGQEMFFGFYRIDGLNLSKHEFLTCDKNLPLYFRDNGEYREIVQKKRCWLGKEKIRQTPLSVARVTFNDSLFDNLKWILQYYLETTFFVPKLEFDKFEKIFSCYMDNSPLDFLENNYTDFEFSFYDSRHFSIYFNDNRIEIDFVEGVIRKYFNQ